jgi:hypothetical protein
VLLSIGAVLGFIPDDPHGSTICRGPSKSMTYRDSSVERFAVQRFNGLLAGGASPMDEGVSPLEVCVCRSATVKSPEHPARYWRCLGEGAPDA